MKIGRGIIGVAVVLAVAVTFPSIVRTAGKVICMNRAHLLNDHMFGFVNVVDGDDDN